MSMWRIRLTEIASSKVKLTYEATEGTEFTEGSFHEIL